MMSRNSYNIVDACDFSVSNKEAAGKNKVCDGSNISNSSSSGGNTKTKTKMMVHHHDNQHRPSPSYEICCGPTWNSSPSSNIYHAMASGLLSGSGLKPLQPFDIATTATSAATETAIKSPGMAASMGFPFTNAQWKELERQAMIYKYMVASVPVPLDLLFPITTNSSAPLGGGLNLIRCSNRGDLEPGRCRRTDGKKWRCSRDVAPDQKYCERHLHRGRPRSRKHVELPANKKKSRLEPNSNTINSNENNFSPNPLQLPGTFTQYDHIQSSEAVTFQSIKEQRCFGLDDERRASSNAFMCRPRMATSDAAADRDRKKHTPRGFIDAWANGVSNEEHNGNKGAKSSVSSGGNLTLFPLSLSMGAKNVTDEEMGQVQMGLGLAEPGQDHDSSSKTPLSSWLNDVSWVASTPGGPLAEVLRPSAVATSGSPSATAGNGYSGSPSATAVSSPSGVLQKTLASFSDSSGSSSPTLGSSRTNKPESTLLSLSQGKLESSS